MGTYGGLGGVKGGRSVDLTSAFELAVERALGAAMRSDPDVAEEVWSALANVDWFHENGDEAGYSFRAAGDLVAAIMGSGDYLDWYCSGPSGVLSDRVGSALVAEGWRWRLIEA
jgi:hypothetical protein